MKFKGKFLQKNNLPTKKEIVTYGKLINIEQLMQDLALSSDEIPRAFTDVSQNTSVKVRPVVRQNTAEYASRMITKDSALLFMRLLEKAYIDSLKSDNPIDLGEYPLKDYGILEDIVLNVSTFSLDSDVKIQHTNAELLDTELLAPYVYSEYAQTEFSQQDFVRIMRFVYRYRISVLSRMLKLTTVRDNEYSTMRQSFFATQKEKAAEYIEFIATHIPEDAFLHKVGVGADLRLQSWSFDPIQQPKELSFLDTLKQLETIITDGNSTDLSKIESVFGDDEERINYVLTLEFQKYLIETGVISYQFQPVLQKNYQRYFVEQVKFASGIDKLLAGKYRSLMPVNAVGSYYGDTPSLSELLTSQNKCIIMVNSIIEKYRAVEGLSPELFSVEVTDDIGKTIDYSVHKNHIMEYYSGDEPGIILEYLDAGKNRISFEYYSSSVRNILIHYSSTNCVFVRINIASQEGGVTTVLDSTLYSGYHILIYPNYPQRDQEFRVTSANITTFLSKNDWFEKYTVANIPVTDTEEICLKRKHYWYLASCHKVLPGDELLCRMSGFQYWLDRCHVGYPDNAEDCQTAGYLWRVDRQECISPDISDWDKTFCDYNGWFFIKNKCVSVMPDFAACISAGYRWINNLCVHEGTFSRYACESIGAWYFNAQCFYYPPTDELTCTSASYHFYLGTCHKTLPTTKALCEQIGCFWFQDTCNKTMPTSRFICFINNWYWFAKECHMHPPTTKADCDELMMLFYLSSCVSTLPTDRDICVALNLNWFNSSCHRELPQTQVDCDEIGGVWANDRCYKMLPNTEEYSEFVCVSLLKYFFFNGTCSPNPPVTAEDCAEVGEPYVFFDGRCTKDQPVTEADCAELRYIWAGGECFNPAFFTEATCEAANLLWFNDRCYAALPSLEAECIAAGFYFFNGECSKTPPTTEADCIAIEMKWYGGKCNRALPRFEIPCKFFKFKWSSQLSICTEE